MRRRPPQKHAVPVQTIAPAKRGGHFSAELTEQATALFRARTGRDVSEDEARSMLANLTDFFLLLLEWDRRDKRRKAGIDPDSDRPALED